jgi:hypothetical protein
MKPGRKHLIGFPGVLAVIVVAAWITNVVKTSTKSTPTVVLWILDEPGTDVCVKLRGKYSEIACGVS